MKKELYRERFTLTLLFAVITFLLLLISVGLSAGAVVLITRLPFFSGLQHLSAYTQLLLLMVLVSVVVGFGVALFAGRFLMRPLNRLIDQLDRLARGDFKARLDFGKVVGSHDAFAEITHSFNTMARELENTELLHKDFINNFSHEFKTPIVSIAGFAGLLRRGHLPEEQQAEYLAIMEEESLRLAAMATNVLQLSRLERQAILTDVSTYNLSEQLRACVLLLEEQWSRKDLELDLEFEEYEIAASEELLKHVWINLLDNAVKFSPRGGELRLRVCREDGHLAVSITNYGADIPPEQQEKIFQKFYQGDESHAAQGNGVGLAIVKRVAELHRGSVSVRSGDGATTFTVELPETQNI